MARRIRQHQRMRQVDAAERAGVSRASWSRFERQGVDGLSFRAVDAMLAAIGARLEVELRWRGASADRMLDEWHASLCAAVIALLARYGWRAEAEVTFSSYGERGSIDILAWHPPTRTLAVFEVKTEIGSIEGLLRGLDAKVRLAPAIARDRSGWRAAHVGEIVVLPESAQVRRHWSRHEAVLTSRFSVGSRAIRAWLRSPDGEIRGRWFLSISTHASGSRNPSAVQRVRATQRPAGARLGGPEHA
jgi:transcriptional regulator with XRE-family HTH domain